ncbi:MAG TPA: hypothetical protein VIP11_20930, partial [Gemmatimonadaceae bacterium]
VALDTSAGATQARIVVTGVDAANIKALRAAGWTAEPRAKLLQITVAETPDVQVAGRYSVSDTAIEFRPLFPFDAGRVYGVRVEPKELPVARSDSAFSTTIALPAPPRAPSTVVQRILPTTGALPENQLRIYIEFSAPMSRRSGVDFVHLIDDSGREVTHAFLPLDADFWSPDHTRYTVFLDPGRVKRGITPNEQLGRPLRAGRAYALVVDSAWRDANGLPLARPFRIEFTAGPAVLEPISLAAWKTAPPRAGTRDPLVVTFPRALDHGLLQRAVGVAPQGQSPLVGDIVIGPGETEWRFTPRDPWRAGDYNVIALSILEDVAGNRIGRPFEVDMFDRVDSTATAERFNLPFKIR